MNTQKPVSRRSTVRWCLTSLAVALLPQAGIRHAAADRGHEACGHDVPDSAHAAMKSEAEVKLREERAKKIRLDDAIDIHIHTAPDNTPRLMDDFDTARAARKAKMRAIVIKSHIFQSATRAELTRRVVPGIEVFGGIAFNRSTGGINIEALKEVAKIEGLRGKIVWLPTRDKAFIPVVSAGVVVPQLAAVLPVIATNNMVLATGHSTPADSKIIIDAAQAAGVQKILVTHAMSTSVGATIADMQHFASKGVKIELVHLATVGFPNVFVDYANAIKTVGAQHFILSSDLGQPTNVSPVDGMRELVSKLMAEGITQAEIDMMIRSNPAALLGLTP